MATTTAAFSTQTTGRATAAGATASPEAATRGTQTFQVRVEVPSGPYNEYRYDSAQRAFRLEAVVRPEQTPPADLGAFVGTLASDGRPLAAILVVESSTMPGCLVETRVLGALTLPGGETRVVAVPAADPALADVASYSDLSPEARETIERFVAETASSASSPDERPRWVGPEEATEIVRESQRAARVAIAANRKVGGAPAWQVIDPMLRRVQRLGEGEAHSEAEYSVQDLPPRFQRHVADCLLPEERILHFVHRPELAVDSRLSFLRPRKLNDGLLVATDRQVLWMTDALPPDSTLVDWGYLATSAPVEQVVGVRLDESGPTLRLEVELQARSGSEVLAMEFGRPSLEACRHMASVLARFVLRPDTRALLRLYEVKPAPADLSEAIAMAEPEAVSRLEALAAQVLPADEEVIARALAPTTSDRRRGASLLVVTSGHVVLFEARRGGPVVVGSWAVEDIASAELRYSILGSGLKLSVPADGRREQVGLDSESPMVFGPMLRAFRALLPLLANPTPARPESLQQQDEQARPEG